jgi:predicted amidohydrolase
LYDICQGKLSVDKTTVLLASGLTVNKGLVALHAHCFV